MFLNNNIKLQQKNKKRLSKERSNTSFMKIKIHISLLQLKLYQNCVCSIIMVFVVILSLYLAANKINLVVCIF